MLIDIIYSSHHPEKRPIEKTIKLINKIQNEYYLNVTDSGILSDYLFNEPQISFEFCTKVLSQIDTNYCIYIIDKPFFDNWFSHNARTVSIITTDSWNDHFAPPSIISYLLYQLTQAFLGFSADINENNLINRAVHYPSIGCINDMCTNKEDIKIGMAAGFVCPSCQVTLRQYGVKESELQAIEEILQLTRLQTLAKPLPLSVSGDETKVFIVHGHNNEILDMVSEYIESIGLTPIILNRLARNGIDTILNEISKNSDVMCAILLFTGDDQGCKIGELQMKKRARQNVVFEAGYFLGKLGHEKVLLMAEDNLELPSDLDGCLYTKFDSDGVWKDRLFTNLESMGLLPKKS